VCYRVERCDPATGSYTTLASGQVAGASSYMDRTVHEDRLGLYYYRVVFTDVTGAELVGKELAYGIWDFWL